MPSPIAPTPIVAYSGSLPDPSDPTTYGTRGRALWAWEVGGLYSGMNALGANAYSNAQSANESAVNAANSAEAAQFIAGATLWASGTYTTGEAVVSPIDLQTYRRNSPGGTDATDPSASGLWTIVGSKFAPKESPTFNGALTLNTGFGLPATTISTEAYMSGLPSNGGAAPALRPVFMNKVSGSTMVGAAGNGVGTISGFWGTVGGEPQWGGIIFKGNGVEVTSGYSNFIGSPGPIRFMFKGTETAQFDYRGVLSCAGIVGRQGISGGELSGFAMNLWWTGSALQAWAHETNLGNLTISSDYRVKKSVQPITEPALARVMKLRPVTYEYADNEQFNFKADGVAREGFIAHELAEVVPSAVEGEKDAQNQVQSLRLDPLVALLVKAVQELRMEVAELRSVVCP